MIHLPGILRRIADQTDRQHMQALLVQRLFLLLERLGLLLEYTEEDESGAVSVVSED
jgi:hypothetical protein